MSSISIATMGKFNGAPTSSDDSGGGGGGGTVIKERKKPIVRVTKVKYDKKKRKHITVVEVKQ